MNFEKITYGDNFKNILIGMFKCSLANFLLSMDGTFVFTDINNIDIKSGVITYKLGEDLVDTDINTTLDQLLTIFNKQFLPSEKELFIDMFIGLVNIDDYGFEIHRGKEASKYLGKHVLSEYIQNKYSILNQNQSIPISNINFVEANPEQIAVLTLKDSGDPDKIMGRAIIFNNVNLIHQGEPKAVHYMDRIYTGTNGDVYLFKLWARVNNCVHLKNNLDGYSKMDKVYRGIEINDKNYTINGSVDVLTGSYKSSARYNSNPFTGLPYCNTQNKMISNNKRLGYK